MRNAEEYNEELLNLAQGLKLSDWDNVYTEFIKRVQTEAWNAAIEAAAENAEIGVEEADGSTIMGKVVQVTENDTLCIHKPSILRLKK